MDAWWFGTISTLAGAVTAAMLQAWRERVHYRRSLRTRWDETLLSGLVTYLSTADRAARTLARWRHARDNAEADTGNLAVEALAAFEDLHEESHVITLLTGDRDDALRAASRLVREPLRPLCDEVRDKRSLSAEEVQTYVGRHRDARTNLIAAAQTRLGVASPEWELT